MYGYVIQAWLALLGQRFLKVSVTSSMQSNKFNLHESFLDICATDSYYTTGLQVERRAVDDEHDHAHEEEEEDHSDEEQVSIVS